MLRPNARQSASGFTLHVRIAVGQIQVVSFIEPSQADVIEEMLNGHQSGAMVGGLWQSRSRSAPPAVDELVLELDVGYSGNSLDTPVEADESLELTYVDIDTFLAIF